MFLLVFIGLEVVFRHNEFQNGEGLFLEDLALFLGELLPDGLEMLRSLSTVGDVVEGYLGLLQFLAIEYGHVVLELVVFVDEVLLHFEHDSLYDQLGLVFLLLQRRKRVFALLVDFLVVYFLLLNHFVDLPHHPLLHHYQRSHSLLLFGHGAPPLVLALVHLRGSLAVGDVLLNDGEQVLEVRLMLSGDSLVKKGQRVN